MIYRMNKTRREKDILGWIVLPAHVYYGKQTQRALENFPISGLRPHQAYSKATVVIKKAASMVNSQLKLLEERQAKSIITACDEILEGKLADQFVVDPYQAGAGTSHNMNVNEVIANRANELLGGSLGSYKFIHPNDHVNMSQSTNDVIPTAVRITILNLLPQLLTNVAHLISSFSTKAKEFSKILKPGRTHLQDALPVTLGQEFSAYTQALLNDKKRLEAAKGKLLRIGIGGTATGTGINTHPKYHHMMVNQLSQLLKLPLSSNINLSESMQNTADFLEVSASLRSLSHTLIRIGNDLRLLSSGPMTGFAEIQMPPVQPGSSMMPGKVNPSIVEMLTMVCYQVIGNDQTILLASMAGQLELNVMLPLISFNLFEQIKLLTNAIAIFDRKCVQGLKANKEMCRFWSERNMGIAAILNPYIGYERTALLVKSALKTHKSLQKLTIEKGYLTRQKAYKIFSASDLTHPNIK